MRRLVVVLVATMAGLPLAACSSDPVEMPELVGKRLDVAKSDIEKAGLDEPEVLGGGMLGIVVESNWTVCEQEPAAGESTTEKPRLTVDRDCGGDEEEGTDEPSDGATVTEDGDATDAAQEESTEPAVPEILTVKNSKELATLLRGDENYELAARFAKKYAGHKIEFDANFADVGRHGDYDTRIDVLVLAGNYSKTTARGPNFQFSDVGSVGLLSGDNIPEFIATGLNVHVVAEVGEFSAETGLFQLYPDTVTVR